MAEEKKKEIFEQLQEMKDIIPTSGFPALEFISTGSIALDRAIKDDENSGIPVGRFTEIYGLPSTGKSVIGMRILANTQKRNGIAILLDTEDSFHPNWAEKNELDVEKLILFTPADLESTIDKVEEIMKVSLADDKKFVTIVVDSLSSPPSKEELSATGDEIVKLVAIRSRIITVGLRKWNALFVDFKERNKALSKTTIVVINHAKKQFGKYDPFWTPGGWALKYHAAVRIMLSQGSKIMSKGRQVGVKSGVTIQKNKIDVPYRKAEFRFFYDGRLLEVGKQNTKSELQEEMEGEASA